MPIECSVWPMSELTRASGEKNRVLLVHPKHIIDRKYIKRGDDGKLHILDSRKIRMKNCTFVPEMKEAGHRHFFSRDAKGRYACYGRRLNVNNTYTDIFPKLSGMDFPFIPKGTVIDFELCWPGHPDSEVVTAIKECPKELVMKGFCIPIYDSEVLVGEDSWDYDKGRSKLVAIMSQRGSFSATKRWSEVKLGTGQRAPAETLEHLLNKSEEMGIEGFVLKEKFCDRWWKLKGVNDADVIVSGFKISKAETRMGMVTAVQVSVYGKHGCAQKIGNVAGFNLEEMNAMTEDVAKTGGSGYLGKVLRITYQELAGQGGLKHAFRDCWRDDKNPMDCGIEQFR